MGQGYIYYNRYNIEYFKSNILIVQYVSPSLLLIPCELETSLSGMFPQVLFLVPAQAPITLCLLPYALPLLLLAA